MDPTPPPTTSSGDGTPEIERERNRALHEVEQWLETPVVLLGFLWLVLLIIDLAFGLSSFLNAVMYFIWGVFLFDFLLRFALAPRKGLFLRRNWLTALSLFIPALRIGRLARILQAARLGRALRAAQSVRGLRLVSLISSVNRGMRSLRKTMVRRGFGYVLLLTVVVALVGAAGMYAFERQPAAEGGLQSYGESLWWTAMIMTTLGSNYWPVTAEGRLLTLLLALYAFAVFGYVTATLATFFIGTDAAKVASDVREDDAAAAIPVTAPDTEASAASAASAARLHEELEAMRAETTALRQEIIELRRALNQDRRKGED